MASHTAVLGLQLFTQLIKLGVLNSSTGAFISPYSAFITLVLLFNGAGLHSPTHQQLYSLLTQSQLPTTSLQNIASAESALNRNISAAMGRLLLQSNQNDSKLVVANALWTKSIPLLSEYGESMMRLFQAPVTAVATAEPINTWAENSTNGLIKKAVPDGVDFDMVITNAVYFKGSWLYPFDKADTDKAEFTTASNTLVEVDMMQMSYSQDDVFWAEGGDFRALKLPHAGSSIKAVAVLASKDRYGVDADGALAGIGVEKILTANWIPANNAEPSLSVKMPRFRVEAELMPLKQALQSLHMTAAFDPRQADFSRLSEEPLFVTDAYQSVVVIVDEVGTEAAAVTSVTMRLTSLPSETTPPMVFDRPFIFLLIDESSGSVLFLGTVRDPTGTSTYQPSKAVQLISREIQDSVQVNISAATSRNTVNGSDVPSSTSGGSSSSVAVSATRRLVLSCALSVATLVCL